MRLSPAERQTIRQVVDRLTGGRGRVWLFGSRIDDAARGGDIDLLIECPEPVEHPARLMASIGAHLEMALGERRIDVLLQAPNLQQFPVHRVARETGVQL
ncbi:nucleotidyltransferase domain-containing protein [Azohydromonas aeria]|uniref:nucleotidyltransferase domain-containing protein n=1 Tax=Azohydromonas aeria TaxID=2590212 RepID=UPI0012FB06BD|nr:nucleotidyltransferase domain-containing protein [Azohydromonas aeria]